MIVPGYTVLLADPDARMRSLISAQLGSIGCTLLEAEDGNSALRAITSGDVRVVIAELYLQTGEDDCLIHAIRRAKELRKTRALALTRYATAVDRDWAMRAGADAFLL